MAQESLQNIMDAVASLQEEMNQDVDQINKLIDTLEERDNEIIGLKQLIDKQDHIMDKQHEALKKSNDEYSKMRSKATLVNTELKTLQTLDPKRLAKVNKTQKTKITELKDKVSTVEAARKLALKQVKEMEQRIKVEGAAPIFTCPETGNAIRLLPGLRVAAGNKQGGVENTPVLEFLHATAGVTQQGFLLEDGSIGWADTTVVNKPSAIHSDVALKFIHDYCKSNKIKVK